MSNQSKSVTDIKQLKLNILNRSASFKKNRNDSSEGNQIAQGEEKGYQSPESGYKQPQFDSNDSEEEDTEVGTEKSKHNENASNANINMNLQARVLAFHEQRQNLKRSSSIKHQKSGPVGEERQTTSRDNSPIVPTNEGHRLLSNRTPSFLQTEASIEGSYHEKRGSLVNVSPVTPSIEVVNKPLPPLPPQKTGTPSAVVSTSLNTKTIEKKMQKLSMIKNRSLNNLKMPPPKQIYEEDDSSISSIVTSDSESDFDHKARNHIIASDNGIQQKNMIQEIENPNNKDVFQRNEKSGSVSSRNVFNKPVSPKPYINLKNTISPLQLSKDKKPLSPFRITSFGAISDGFNPNNSQNSGEMNPKRKAPPVPSSFQFPTPQTAQLMNLKRGNVAATEAFEQPKLNNRSQQKIKMGLSARRGLKLDMSQMHQSPAVASAPPLTQQQQQQVIPLKLPSHVAQSSADFNSVLSIDSLSSTDSNMSSKNTSGNWSNLSSNNRVSQIYGSNTGNNNNGVDSISSLNNGVNSAGVGSIFANFSKYVNVKNGSLNFAGKLSLSSNGINFSNGSSFSITFDELEYIGELGRGNYGNVSKVLHKPTQIIMAMKEVRLELDESKFRQILMELDVLHKCSSSYIIDFYGAFFVEGAVYMCMECMDGGSLDRLYTSKGAYDSKGEPLGVPESVLAKIAEAVTSGLKVLKDDHNIIHRDVKPTNILCSANEGTVKLCDFGVSGNLVASLAKTNIGCQSYMAPERIKSFNPDAATYTVHSDVWSLGLTLVEVALGKYPYPPETFGNIFSQLSAIVDGKPPSLPKERFSAEAQDFINCCLEKNPERRANYAELLQHPWLQKYKNLEVDMKGFLTQRLDTIKKWELEHNPLKDENSSNVGENSAAHTSMSSDSNSIPALHNGGWYNH
ncbi:hypothetical protein QEN19_000620 [Hanseniaspora menglaensis]